MIIGHTPPILLALLPDGISQIRAGGGAIITLLYPIGAHSRECTAARLRDHICADSPRPSRATYICPQNLADA